MKKRIDSALLEAENAKRESDLNSDYAALGEKLAREDIDIETITAKAGEFQVAVPSWGTGTGGTRFARFPGEGEPRRDLICHYNFCVGLFSPFFGFLAW